MENEKNRISLLSDYNYLRCTDWYYIRKVETGEEVPADVVIKRKEAREFIRANEVKE